MMIESEEIRKVEKIWSVLIAYTKNGGIIAFIKLKEKRRKN
jgi:hypothetical protein